MSGPDIAGMRLLRGEKGRGELHGTEQLDHNRTFEERSSLLDAA